MGKSIWDTISAPISTPLNAAAGVVHGLGNSLSDIPVIGGLAKYGGIGLSDAIHSVADASNANFSKAANDTLSSFSNAIHGVNQIPVVGQYVLPAVASIWGGPLGYAAASGIQNGFENSRKGQPFGKAVLSGAQNAGLSYIGSQAGSALGDYAGNTLSGTQLGDALNQTPAAMAGNVFGGDTVGAVAPFGSFAGNLLGSSTVGQTLGSAVGANLSDSSTGYQPNPQGFSPSRQPQMGIPQSLSQLSSLDPFQQATNIASKGVYGGGNGPQENQYFLNLINRQLVDSSGNVGKSSSVNPIENSYLSQLGLGGYGSPTDLLKGINSYSS